MDAGWVGAGDERLAQGSGRAGEVRGHAESTEALAEDAPSFDPQLATDPLGVVDYRIGAEVREVIGLLPGRESRQRSDRRRAAGAALVEHEDSEFLQSPVEPTWPAWISGRPRGLVPGTALEEDEKRTVQTVGVADFPREHRDALAVWARMVERDREFVLGQNETPSSNYDRHAAIVYLLRRDS